MASIEVSPFRIGQEALVAHIHNTAFAAWMTTLEGCYRYSRLTPEHVVKKMQLHGHKKAIGDTGVIQKEMIRMYRRFGFDLSRRLLNWVKIL